VDTAGGAPGIPRAPSCGRSRMVSLGRKKKVEPGLEFADGLVSCQVQAQRFRYKYISLISFSTYLKFCWKAFTSYSKLATWS
jgi:hypothetical protein